MARMTMGKVNPDNVWKLTTETGAIHFVRCPSKSGAKIFLAAHFGMKGHRVEKAEIYLPEQVPEGAEVLQATFPNPADPKNWTEAGRV